MTYIVKGKVFMASERQDVLTLLWSYPHVDSLSIRVKLNYMDTITFKITCEESKFKAFLSNLSNLGFIVKKIKQQKIKKKAIGRL